MSKFCFHCKLELDDNISSCPQCKNIVEAQIPVFPVVEPVAEKAFNYGKLNKILFKTAGIGMIALLTLLFINIAVAISQKPEERKSSSDNKSYLKPIDILFDGIIDEDSAKHLSAYPEFISRYLENIMDNEFVEDFLDEQKDKYGENVKITYKVTNKEKHDKDDLKYWERAIKTRYYEIVDVTDGYDLEVDVIYTGEDDNGTDEVGFTVLKIDGKWHVMEGSGYFEYY